MINVLKFKVFFGFEAFPNQELPITNILLLIETPPPIPNLAVGNTPTSIQVPPVDIVIVKLSSVLAQKLSNLNLFLSNLQLFVMFLFNVNEIFYCKISLDLVRLGLGTSCGLEKH